MRAMRDQAFDVLLQIGVPAGVKGMTYLCDALEMFDSDPYYLDGKISALYFDIANKHGTTSARVERAIRHAFETALTKGNKENVEKYLDVTNKQNSNLMKCLYFRIQQENRKKRQVKNCTSETCAVKQEIYQEAMTAFFSDLQMMMEKHMGIQITNLPKSN